MVALVSRVTGPSISSTGLLAAPTVNPVPVVWFPVRLRASQTPPVAGRASMHFLIFSPASAPAYCSARSTDWPYARADKRPTIAAKPFKRILVFPRRDITPTVRSRVLWRHLLLAIGVVILYSR